ncbi:MAG: hypothetical protein P8P74_09020 [Crocinitomicaceae bacterium]|nr:hypothetical protein [Crocinitomicaceae bacterium]
MLRTSLILLFVSSFFSLTSFSQQRVGVDVSSRLDNLLFTVHYQKVLKNRFLYSAGVQFGGHGSSFISNDTMRLYTGRSIESPYSNANQPIVDPTGSYSLLDYKTTARSVGIQVGLGYFHEFDVRHGLRFNLNSSISFVSSRIGGYYRSINNFTEQYRVHTNNHFAGSVSLEAYHTMRLTGRMTFNYGVKIPYFFTVDRAKFDPTVQKDLVYGFEPLLSIGMTRVIGKCE